MFDTTEQKRMMTRLVPHLRAYASIMLANAEDADDLTEAAIRVVWQQSGEHVRGRTFRVRVLKAMHDCAWNGSPFRSQRADGLSSKRVDDGAASLGSMKRTAFEASLLSVPAWAREAVLLVDGMGFTPVEAASICGCSLGDLRERALFGRRALLSDEAAIFCEESSAPSRDPARKLPSIQRRARGDIGKTSSADLEPSGFTM